MNYDCPHCGKFSLSTFCKYCGKPTESIWKYRIMYLLGLIVIPLITSFCYIEFHKVLLKLVEMGEPMGTNIADLMAMAFLFSVGFAILTILFIVYWWISIEIQFYNYNKTKKEN